MKKKKIKKKVKTKFLIYKEEEKEKLSKISNVLMSRYTKKFISKKSKSFDGRIIEPDYERVLGNTKIKVSKLKKFLLKQINNKKLKLRRKIATL